VSQLGLHAKPCGILNVRGYYTPLLAMFDHAVEERFLKPQNRGLVLARESAAEFPRAPECDFALFRSTRTRTR